MGPKKKVANIEIYVIFEVFAFCGRRTKTDFKDRDSPPESLLVTRRRSESPGLQYLAARNTPKTPVGNINVAVV